MSQGVEEQAQTVLADDPWIGRVLDGGRYRVDAPLGAGGVGAVYRGVQLTLGRPVAIKVLLEGLHPSFAARFEREAAALAALRHPNIVTVVDAGIDSGAPYLVMELIEGRTLFARLHDGPLPQDEILSLARQLLRALAFVHEQGLVHRDLKPGNVLIEKLSDGEERLRLLDFGLAKFVGGASGEGEVVTRAGDVLGTPSYMAPEQVAGDAADARTDLYAVGVMLYQMLADGRTPFEGAPVELLRAQLVSVPPALRDKRKDVDVHPELEALLARALSKPPEDRFQSAGEMLAALEAIEGPWFAPLDLAKTEAATMREAAPVPAPSVVPADRARRLALAAMGASVAAVLALVLFALWHRGSRPVAAHTASEPTSAPMLADEPMLRSEDSAGTTLATTLPGAGQTPSSRPAAFNPWSRPAPRLLDDYRRAALEGDRGNERAISALRRYNREHATDTRGHLVLAMLYRNRSWREDVVHQYELAYARDARSRGAPDMLRDLLKIAIEGEGASEEARALVVRAYGAEALPVVDRLLAAPKLEKPEIARLVRLRNALAPN